MSNLRIDEVLEKALAVEPSQRENFLDTACGADTALRHAVKERLYKEPGSNLQNLETKVNNPYSHSQDSLPDIPNYKIRSVLGRGGMGIVYRADQTPLHRPVALKMLATQGPPTNEQLARFHAEAAALAKLRHPNIVEIYDYGEWRSRPYFVMELVEGQSLAARAEGIPQVPRFAAHLMMIVARAVQAVHQQGILHRDLKPGNILLQNFSAEDPHKTIDPMTSVTFEGRVLAPKITDFGVAKDLLADQKFTMTGTAVGTPQYMAPEQAESEYQAMGPATDVYGLGATLYELLTGQPPIRGATPLETLAQIATHEPAPPSRLQPGVPRDLDVICGKCLEKLPTRRYATAQALADDLQCYLEQRPIKARPTGSFTRAVRWFYRHPMVAGFAGLSAVLACALVASMLVYNFRLTRALSEAKANAEESRERMVKLFTVSGMSDVEEGLAFNGLLWFSEGLHEDQGRAEAERRHRTRYATTYNRVPHLRYLWGGTDHLSAITVSPNGQWTAIADLSGGVQFWELASGRKLGPLLKLSSPLISLALSNDGKWAAGIDSTGVVRLWDPTDSKTEGRIIKGEAPFDQIIFHPAGEVLILRQKDSVLRLWNIDAKAWKQIPGWPAKPPIKTILSLDGSRAATITESAETTVSEKESKKLIARVWSTLDGPGGARPMLLDGSVQQMAVSNDGHRLAIVDDRVPSVARIWDVQEGQPLKVPEPHANVPAVLGMAFNPKGTILMTSNADHRGRFWDARTGALAFIGLPNGSDSPEIAFSMDGKLLATGGFDNQARVWNVPRGDARTPPLQHQGTLQFVAFGHNDAFLLTADPNALRVWEFDKLPAPTVLPRLELPALGIKEEVSADGRYRLVIDGAAAQVFTLEPKKSVGAPLVHASDILFGVFSPDSQLVVTTSDDNTARIWKAATGELLTSPLVHAGDVLFAVFSPDGKEIVTTSRDRTARLWDVATGEPLSPSWVHDQMVVVASFSPDGLQVFTRDSAGKMYPWDIRPDPRPVEILQLWAQVLSGSRFVKERGEVPLETKDLYKIWSELQQHTKDD
jgi:serine/threonine protein kinase/WD40 repeat protein